MPIKRQPDSRFGHVAEVLRKLPCGLVHHDFKHLPEDRCDPKAYCAIRASVGMYARQTGAKLTTKHPPGILRVWKVEPEKVQYTETKSYLRA